MLPQNRHASKWKCARRKSASPLMLLASASEISPGFSSITRASRLSVAFARLTPS